MKDIITTRSALLAQRATRPIVLAISLFAAGLTAIAQVPVPVGAGSYASFIPPFVADADEYYGLGAQQIVDMYPNLHLDPSLTARPLPSNKWWTDILVADRSSFNSTNVPPRTPKQDPYGGSLWAYPVQLAPNSNGFNLYFPNAWTPRGGNTNAPNGSFASGASLPITGSTNNGAGVYHPLNSVVTDWSDWGFQFKLPDTQGNYLQMTLARGVPFVWTTCSGVRPRIGAGGATLYDTNNAVIPTAGGTFSATAFSFDYQGRSFGVFAPDNTTFKVLTGNLIEAQLSGTNNYLVYGLLPARTNLNEFAQYAFAQVTGTRMDWVYDRPNGQIDTTWTLTTVPLKGTQTNTLQGWLPHHYRSTQNNLVFKPYTYLTPRGVMKVAAGTQFQINYNFRGIAPVLPPPQTNGLPNDFVSSRMTSYVQTFANGGHPTGDETYGAGKDLAVTAQYLTFARQLGLDTQKTQLKAALENRLQDWYTYTPGESHHFFALYTNWPALIGSDASYGSQAFNDNHFHYGYFMVATALLGTEDPGWLDQYGPMAKRVAKQYANWDRTDLNFPLFRTFDIWEGHSWAGGTSSGGGENQESSSEAMNSWVGLFLMGNVLGDDDMTAAGAMGYCMESAAVNEYWQDMYRTNFPPSYGKAMGGICWSGAISYATYFDGDPAWIFGIQMVPQNHWNNYLVRDKNFANWQFTNLWNERILASQYGINGFTLADSNNPTALGGYLGNYILGWQLLFDADGVAAQMDSGYATNAGIATDGVYSGITYYLTHSLRGLGDQDFNYYTSIPTSQVYYNPRTGARTTVIYNPAATTQIATIYNQGTAVSTVTASPQAFTVHATVSVAGLQPVASPTTQISWPTTLGNNYEPQWATPPTNSATWADLAGLIPGNGNTNSLFDAPGVSSQRAYRVLALTTTTVTNAVNGGFESGTGTTAANWTTSGSQPPVRISTNSHSGTYSMKLANTNKATGGISFQQDQKKQGGPPVVPGLSYTFSFWAQQNHNGAGLVQNYKITWLDTNSATVSSVTASFTGGNGFWNLISVPGLVAPANAVEARITFSSTTGTGTDFMGEVLIDDVSLTTSAPGPTNQIPVTVQPGYTISWPSVNHASYGIQWANALGSTNVWTDFGLTIPGTGGNVSVFDPMGGSPVKFYRVYSRP